MLPPTMAEKGDPTLSLIGITVRLDLRVRNMAYHVLLRHFGMTHLVYWLTSLSGLPLDFPSLCILFREDSRPTEVSLGSSSSIELKDPYVFFSGLGLQVKIVWKGVSLMPISSYVCWEKEISATG